MIKRRTVLILGAGASAPFGFPVGRTLRDQIVANLRKPVNQPFQFLWRDGGGDSRSYKPSELGSEAGLAMGASSAIKIVHEGTKDDPDFVRARKIIESAELVCFLGFGYLEANIERLQVHQWPEPLTPLYGSAYKFMDGEIAAATQALGRPLKVWVGDALATLRHYGILT